MSESENTRAAVPRSPTKATKRAVVEAMRSTTDYLIATFQAERALKAGNCAPPFRLRDQRGAELASETLLTRGPVLLAFYSGSWCPPCNRDLKIFERLRPDVEKRGATFVSISQQTVAENLKVHDLLKLRFPILSDRGARIAEQFGVRWRVPKPLRELHRKSGVDLPLLDGNESWALPIPARFILDRAGVIVYSEVNPGHSSPSNARDVLPVLDHLRSPWGTRVGASLRDTGSARQS
jgi:peroxiredoxin